MLKRFLCLVAAASIGACLVVGQERSQKTPNIVLFFADDLGYGDLGVYGARGFKTPNLDRLAKEGMRFTDFHVAESVCTASRVGLMTGSYPVRVGLGGAIGPGKAIGINPDELLLPEILKEAGYATGGFGKWHLGDQHEFLPLQNGFDEFFGLPYSNDMWPFHPKHSRYPPLPLLEGNEVKKASLLQEDQNQLTSWYTEKAVDFVERHEDEPFFLYVAHSMPHVPLGVSERFAGKTNKGTYGDVVAEIDWSVGQVLEALEEKGIAENTWVIFTSDNGPWKVYGDHAGSSGPFRSGKHTVYEGGFRVPCLMRWPETIPAGSTSNILISAMDILPTVAAVVGKELPRQRFIDGHNILRILKNEAQARTPWDAYFYFKKDLRAVRSGKWKLILRHEGYSVASPGSGGQAGVSELQEVPLSLYDLKIDPCESIDLSADRPDIVDRLEKLAVNFLGDLKRQSREAGLVEEPVLLSPRPEPEGRVLLSLPGSEAPQEPWLMPHGSWSTEDGYLQGVENKKEKHDASVKGYAEFTDATFEYQMRFEGGDRHTLGINQSKGHLFHIDFRPDEIEIVKNDLRKDGGKKAQYLAVVPAKVPEGQWVPVKVVISGETVTASVGATEVTATHPDLSRAKGSFNLYVSGDTEEGAIGFREFSLIVPE